MHSLCGQLLFLLLLAQAALAGRIEFRVTDESGRALPGATIRLVPANGAPLLGSSDRQGRFSAEAPGGPLELRVTHIGYTDHSDLVEAGDLGRITLVPRRVSLGEVKVVTGRATSGEAVSRSNLDREELSLRNAGQDLATLLEGTPALLTTSYSGLNQGYNDIRLRGFDQKRIEVLLNGVPVNDPEDHYVYWVNLMDMGSSLEDIQIQRGTGTAVFGANNFGGTVNMVTQESREGGFRVEGTIGSHGTRRESVQWASGLVDGRWMLDARYSQVKTDGFRERSDSDSRGVALSGTRLFGESGKLRLSHYSGRELTRVAWDGIPMETLEAGDRTQNNYAAYPNSVDDFRQPQTQVQFDWQFDDGTRLDLLLYHVNGDGFYETMKTGEDLVDYGFQPWTGWDAEADTTVEIGESDIVNRRWIRKHQNGLGLGLSRPALGGVLRGGLNGWLYRGEHFGEVLWGNRLPPDSPPGGRYYTHLSHKTRVSPWLGYSRSLREGLQATLTLNLSYTDYELEQRPDGNFGGADLHSLQADHLLGGGALGLSWKARPEVTVYGGIGYSAREPSRSEYWQAWQGPDDLGAVPAFRTVTVRADGSRHWEDPQAEPETVLDLEAGVRWEREDLALSANLYHMMLRDEIILFGGFDEESPIRGNAPRSHHSGLEIEAAWRPLRLLQVGGNAAFSRNRIDELTVYSTRYNADWSSELVARDFAGNPIALSPELLLNGWVRVTPLPSLRIRPRVQVVGEQYLDNSGNDGFYETAGLIDPGFGSVSSLPYTKKLDGYTLLGLDADWRLPLKDGLRLELGLKIDNLLDEDYETSGYWNDWAEGPGGYRPQPELYPAAGRSWLTTLALHF